MRRILCLIGLLAVVSMAAEASSDARRLDFGGRSRDYRVYRPAGLSRIAPVPLVIVLHGGFGNGAQAEQAYKWDGEADSGRFVVAYPDGIGRSWNAGGICCGPAHRDQIDDVGFLTALIATVSHDENIDKRRVYLTGMSNGSAMAYRYGCEGTFPIAAIGAVSGSFSYDCPKAHPVSVMEIHGLDDRNIPFAGGHGAKAATEVQWLPVEKTLDVFRRADNCPAPVVTQNGVIGREVSQCADDRSVELITIAGAGHQWPGGVPARGLVAWLLRLDPPSKAMDATSTLWRFFKDHPAE